MASRDLRLIGATILPPGPAGFRFLWRRGCHGDRIEHPDLGGTFEFKLQIGAGVHWFVRDNLALTGEVKYMHMSCAGIDKPNLGLNDVIGLIGLTWFFGK